MFDTSIPNIERALKQPRTPSPLTDGVRTGLRLLRAGGTCSVSGCRHEARVVDGRGRLWCAGCLERRTKIARELR